MEVPIAIMNTARSTAPAGLKSLSSLRKLVSKRLGRGWSLRKPKAQVDPGNERGTAATGDCTTTEASSDDNDDDVAPCRKPERRQSWWAHVFALPSLPRKAAPVPPHQYQPQPRWPKRSDSIDSLLHGSSLYDEDADSDGGEGGESRLNASPTLGGHVRNNCGANRSSKTITDTTDPAYSTKVRRSSKKVQSTASPRATAAARAERDQTIKQFLNRTHEASKTLSKFAMKIVASVQDPHHQHQDHFRRVSLLPPTPANADDASDDADPLPGYWDIIAKLDALFSLTAVIASVGGNMGLGADSPIARTTL